MADPPNAEITTRDIAVSAADVRRRLTRDVGAGLVAAVVSTVVAGGVLHLWDASLWVPFRYAGDSKFYLALIKGVIEHGWWVHNPSVGFPLGQHLYDFPQGGDSLNLLLIKLLGLGSSEPGVVVNVFLLLTFPLTAASAFIALRFLGLSIGAAIVCAVLFSLLPYHFYRGERHVMLSAYWGVPLAAYLAVAVLRGDVLFRRSRADARGPRSWISDRSAVTLAICAVVASTGLYYASFALILIASAALMTLLLPGRGRRGLLMGAVVFAIVAGTFTLELSPSLVYWAQHGRNATAAVRSPVESEGTSLTFAQLVLPIREHRLQPLADLRSTYALRDPSDETEWTTLGLVGTIGMLSLLGFALARCLGRPLSFRASPGLGHASAMLIVTFAFAAVGGGGSLVAWYLTPQLRGWDRLAVFIAFFALMAVGLLLDAAARALPATRRARHGLGVLLLGTLVFGCLDQTTDSPTFHPDYVTARRLYQRDRDFVRAVERQLPRGASVAQLPYIPYPEASRARLVLYDEFAGYIHSRHLRFSYGAMKGRPEDWQRALDRKPLSEQIRSLAASGFGGVWVDRRGYADGGTVIRSVQRLAGVVPVVSANRRLWLFDLRPYTRQLRATTSPTQLAAMRYATFHPQAPRPLRRSAGLPRS